MLRPSEPLDLEAVDRERLERAIQSVLAGFRPTRSEADRRYRRLLVSAHRHSRRGDDLADLLSEPWQRQASQPSQYRPNAPENHLEGFRGLGLGQAADAPPEP